jgi:AcrR family transcriptional regulator
MTRKIRDPQTRERIVDIASAVVAAEGLHGASFRAIAAAAGVSTGLITHYFEDKQELMVAVLRRNNELAAKRVRGATATGTASERLRAAVEAVLPLDPTRRREWQVWVAMWGEASLGGELAAGFRAGWTGLRRIFRDLLQQACREGELRAHIDVPYEADRLVTMLAGLGLLAGVETPSRVRAVATRMLAEQLGSLVAVPARSRPAA